ncbi:response regulator, partial [Brucella gallinifaecis]|uniref:hypothetical protein n=1 Tax=Brucella gallinifaecis TaxID=215590 RepID=UPI001AEDFF89
GGGIIAAEIHLTKRPKLFRQTEPPLTSEIIAEHLSECGIPFIFMTGYSDQSSIPERFRQIEVIRRPIDISSLNIKFNSMINAQI